MLAQLFERRFRSVARVGKDLPGIGAGVTQHGSKNGWQLAAVGGTVAQFGRDDDVGSLVDRSLRMVGIVKAAAGMLHDTAFRIGGIFLCVGLRLPELVLEARLLFRLSVRVRPRIHITARAPDIY